ncbi:MAG TPA: DNA repair protein RecO [Armatimonadota bacterium]|nr:DNA repair protein RecO [Armatimonadota bacterium]
MLRSYRTEALVLRRVNVGETDRILTLLSRDRGKISAIAKGSRRINSSLSGATELGSYGSLQIAMGTNLDVVTQGELKNAFLGLRTSLDRISRALYVLELTTEFLEDRQPHPDLFDLLLSALYSLEKADYLDWVVSGFEAQAMTILGYRPEVAICVSCGSRVSNPRQRDESAWARFSPALGGVLCVRCAAPHRDSMRVSAEVLAAIGRLEEFELPVLGREGAPDAIQNEVRRVLRAHIRRHAEKEMKSTSFIERLRAEA